MSPRPALLVLVRHGESRRNIAKKLWCCRYVLERWTYAEAERRFASEHIPNCSVTHYEAENGRLELRQAGAVFWSQPAPISGGQDV